MGLAVGGGDRNNDGEDSELEHGVKAWAKRGRDRETAGHSSDKSTMARRLEPRDAPALKPAGNDAVKDREPPVDREKVRGSRVRRPV